MTETWFKTGGYRSPIEAVEVERHTEQSVWIDGRRRARRTVSWRGAIDGYYPTWQEAKTQMLTTSQREVEGLRRQLELANSKFGNIKGLKEPTP